MLTFIFLSSGLFLGWSLGANDAANVFGTAVGSKMVRFKTAALISSIFVILGAGISGAGAAHTLGKLGSINEIAGAFVVALAAALTVYWMTRLQLPVSTSQAIVGAIIGWNIFTGSLTDFTSLKKILSTWVLCPVLSAAFAFVFYKLLKIFLRYFKIHLLKLDMYNRIILIVIGAFGSYSLGANNIANVMGVFISVSPFKPVDFLTISFSGTTTLFLLGGVAIAVGIFTYSHRVMKTVGSKIFKLTPESAFIVVLSSSLVLFIFASQSLEHLLLSHNLPSIPLVPVSSSQAVVGAVIGIALTQSGRGINMKMVGKIASGWITTPIIAGLIGFFSLFIVQNVFNQDVYKPVKYNLSDKTIKKLNTQFINNSCINILKNKTYEDAVTFKNEINRRCFNLSDLQKNKIINYSELKSLYVNIELIKKEIDEIWFSRERSSAIITLSKKQYGYAWEFHDELVKLSSHWKYKKNIPVNKKYNSHIKERLEYLNRKFSI